MKTIKRKTQIASLRSGTRNQILNPAIDYSQLRKSTSHSGHPGTNSEDVRSVWSKVIDENPISMTVVIKGLTIECTANWSLSGNSVSYYANISKEELGKVCLMQPAQKHDPWISIMNGNDIVVSNGKSNSYNLCPSLVEII